jgi:hypothetical protein
MWVFCCGMYRSASTLQFQIATRLVEETQTGKRVGWIDALRFAEVREAHQHVDGLKVIKVHRFAEPMGEEFRNGNAIGIYSFRDIRDVYASMMQQQQADFATIWNWNDRDFINACLDSYRSWTSLPNTLISRYEAIIENIGAEVKRIADHLGIAMSDADCDEIAAGLTIKRQQERINQFREALLQRSLDPNDHRKLVDYHDEANLLHVNHISSAKSGRWQDDLSLQQIGLIEDKVKSWCQINQYDPSLFLQSVKAR